MSMSRLTGLRPEFGLHYSQSVARFKHLLQAVTPKAAPCQGLMRRSAGAQTAWIG